MKTPLQILYETIYQKDAPQDPMQIKRSLQRSANTSRNPREKNVILYMLAAQKGTLPSKMKKFGSLLYVAKWFQDNAVDIYEAALKSIFKDLFQLEWPLEHILPILKDNLIARYCYDDINSEPDITEIQDKLIWCEINGLKVATTTSMKNLTNLALKQGASVFIASSERGSVVKFKNSSTTIQILKEKLGGDWALPYPNLLINNSPGNKITLKEIFGIVNDHLMEVAHV